MLNLYCDESCHLENDGESVMLIGGISCPDYVRNIVYKEIKEIKRKQEGRRLNLGSFIYTRRTVSV